MQDDGVVGFFKGGLGPLDGNTLAAAFLLGTAPPVGQRGRLYWFHWFRIPGSPEQQVSLKGDDVMSWFWKFLIG